MQVTHAETLASSSENPAFPVSKNAWTDPHVITGAPLSVDHTFTAAQIVALISARQELVAAPGAGKVIIPTTIVGFFTYGSLHFSTDDIGPVVGYGNGNNIFNGEFHIINKFSDRVEFYDLSTFADSHTAGNIVNQALNLDSISNITGGTGCTLKVHVEYVILDWA